ncbi:MAG TPA: alkaline phosphatase family protein [Candidatus Brocadiia bacterium]|nr:alkaline phosphatase family protein [Candidatus Brocadiales bacterium]
MTYANNPKRRVFILGLDGATFDIIKPLIEKGELPTFKKMIEGGVHGTLWSTIPTVSAPAWTSFATGKNCGKHSIIGFTKRDRNYNGYRIRYLTGNDNKSLTLWDVLSRKGKSVVVINVPMTYPPKKVNGILVSGSDAVDTDANFTFPQSFKEEIFKISSDYKINLILGGYLSDDKRRHKALDMILSSIDARQRLVLHLMDNVKWDLFVVKFNNPDTIQHHFWNYMDPTHPYHDPACDDTLKHAIFSVYKKLDDVLASIINKLDDNTTLIVMSDHGSGQRINKAIYLNEWLMTMGFLSKKSKRPGRFALSDILYNLMEKVLALLLKNLPPKIKATIKRYLPGAISRATSYFKLSGIDWDKTKAFVGEVESIRINLKGEYPHGQVNNGKEYEELREIIIREIMHLKDPETGENVIEKAFKREELYSGPYVEEFPDIILVPKDNKYDISWKFFREKKATRLGDSFVVRQKHWRGTSGMHRLNGIFIMKGKDSKRGVEIANANIIDIFPTVMYQMGLPIPDDVDGKVLTDIFSSEFLKANPVQYEQPLKSDKETEEPVLTKEVYSQEEAGKVKEFLQELGYIE